MKLETVFRPMPILTVAFVLLAPFLLSQKGCPPPMTCEDRVQAANDHIYSVLEENLYCESTWDCTTVDVSTGCMGACPAAVNNDGVDDVRDAVAYANATWCDTYIEDGCPYATPMCAAGDPVCEANTCVMNYY